jgi:hypothetical protein
MVEDSGAWMGAVVLTLGTVIIVTIIVQLTAAWKARTSLAREEDYRKLAEKATAALADSAESRKQIEAELAGIKSRLGAIEKLLREVE